MDPYEMLRQLSFTTTPGFQFDPELGGGMSPDFYELNTPQGFQTKFGGQLTQSGPDTFQTRLQAPGGDKYDLLQAQYKIDPATGQATMVGDPSQFRQQSSNSRFGQNLLEGGALMAAVLGGGAGLDALLTGAVGGGMAGAGATGASAGASAGGIGTMPGLSAANLSAVPGISAASLPSTVSMAALPELATIGAGLGGAAGAMGGLSTANLAPRAAIDMASLPQTVGGAASIPSLPRISGGGLLSGIGSAIANNPLQAATIGMGAIGGAQGGGDQTATTQSRTDPRIDKFLYGNEGILQAASDWYSQNKTGANDTMRAGWNQQLGLLQDPRTMQGLQGLQQSAQGLLGTRIAGNPFMRG